MLVLNFLLLIGFPCESFHQKAPKERPPTNKNIFTGRESIMSSLRMNPDRIIYGVTRDGESCLEMLKAWHKTQVELLKLARS